MFYFRNGEDSTTLYFKADVILHTCVPEKFKKESIKDFGIIPLDCLSLPGHTWQCGLKYTGIDLEALQYKDMILLFKSKARSGISRVMGDGHVNSDEK